LIGVQKVFCSAAINQVAIHADSYCN